MVEATRIAERGRERTCDRDRPRPAARSHRPAAARASGRAPRHRPAAGRSRRDAVRGSGGRARLGSSSARRSHARPPRPAACSSVVRANGSTRCWTIRTSTPMLRACSAARTGLWVPLLVRGRAIGVLAAHDKLGHDVRFTDTDLRLAETFADRAALAVDMSERIASDSLRRAVEAQESERRRIARELHDETGQALTSILLGLKGLEEQLGDADSREAAAELRELVVSTLQDVRRLAVELRPSALDDFGLVAALERLTDLVRRADRDRDRLRDIARRRATPERCRDRPLSHRPGVADERRQARTRASREHPARTPEWRDQGCSRGRRTGIRHGWGGARRLRVGRHARASRAPRGPARGRVGRRERHDGRCRGADRDEYSRPDRGRPRRRASGAGDAHQRRGGPGGGRRGG